MTRPRSPLFWPALLAITAAGLALRITAARGGLWLDEAWSAAFARDVGTPAGVFLNINHDNNHHLNTLWLLLVGWGADPLAQRALAIASGTATIVLAGLIMARRSMAAGLAAAGLFAASPLLLAYGAEARGYAPMLAAQLAMIATLDRWLEAPERRAPTVPLALLALIGTMAQLTMAFGLVAIGGWMLLQRARDAGWRRALIDALRLLGPAAILAGGFAGFVAAQGITFGNLDPFRLDLFLIGLDDLVGYTLGLPAARPVTVLGFAAGAAGVWLMRRDRLAPLLLLALLALPTAVALAALPNSGFARYFLVSSAALLLLMAGLFSRALEEGGLARLASLALFGSIVATSIFTDAALITARRADPAAAIAAMRARVPTGATVSLDRDRAEPVVASAAAQASYPVAFTGCGRLLFVDRDGAEPFPTAPIRCGERYRPIAKAHPVGLSGTHWTLYERAR